MICWRHVGLLLVSCTLAGCDDRSVGPSGATDASMDGGDASGLADADLGDGGPGGDAGQIWCGNDVVEGPEQCDGEDLAETSCHALGFDCGLPGCLEDCHFDTSSCVDGYYTGDILVTLTWDGLGDLDLHLVDDLAGRCLAGGESCRLDEQCPPGDSCDTAGRREWRGSGDCYWALAAPDFGEPQTHNGVPCSIMFDCAEFCDYPRCVGPPGESYCTYTIDDGLLMKDESQGFGPELIEILAPLHSPGPPNVYHIGVHYFSSATNEPRIATVRVHRDGSELFAQGQPGVPLSQLLDPPQPGDNQFWYAGWVIVSQTDATLVPTGLPPVNIATDGYPPLLDPP